MDGAIAFAAVAGIFWALNIVTVRWAVEGTRAPALAGALVGVATAAVFATGIALLSGQPTPTDGHLWKYGLVGAIAPGSSQGLFVAAIASIGPARASILVGTAPMFSVVLAIVFLDETWQLSIVAGTLLTVVGGALISWQPGTRFRRTGVVFALATAVTFAVRDVVARQVNTDSDISSWWAGAIVLWAAALVLMVLFTVRAGRALPAGVRRALPQFLASGLLIGLALPVLLEALDRGQVGVVAPFSNAVQHVSVVVVGSLVFGAGERTPRVVWALLLVVAGGALIATG